MLNDRKGQEWKAVSQIEEETNDFSFFAVESTVFAENVN